MCEKERRDTWERGMAGEGEIDYAAMLSKYLYTHTHTHTHTHRLIDEVPAVYSPKWLKEHPEAAGTAAGAEGEKK